MVGVLRSNGWNPSRSHQVRALGLSAVTTTARQAAFSLSSTAVASTCAASVGPDAEACVSAIDGEPAEQQRRDGIGRAFCDDLGRGRSVDAGHRDARVRDDNVVGVGDDPGRGGVASAVLAGVAAQPFVEHRLAAVELGRGRVGAGQAAPAGAAQSSQLNLRLRRSALGEPVVDLRRPLERLA